MTEGPGGNWQVREFTIEAGHTFQSAPYENIKISATLKCIIKVGYSEDEFKLALKEANDKLTNMLRLSLREQRRVAPGWSNAIKRNLQTEVPETETTE